MPPHGPRARETGRPGVPAPEPVREKRAAIHSILAAKVGPRGVRGGQTIHLIPISALSFWRTNPHRTRRPLRSRKPGKRPGCEGKAQTPPRSSTCSVGRFPCPVNELRAAVAPASTIVLVQPRNPGHIASPPTGEREMSERWVVVCRNGRGTSVALRRGFDAVPVTVVHVLLDDQLAVHHRRHMAASGGDDRPINSKLARIEVHVHDTERAYLHSM